MAQQDKKVIVYSLGKGVDSIVGRLQRTGFWTSEYVEEITVHQIYVLLQLYLELELAKNAKWIKKSLLTLSKFEEKQSSYDYLFLQISRSNEFFQEELDGGMADVFYHDFMNHIDNFKIDPEWVMWESVYLPNYDILFKFGQDYRIYYYHQVEENEKAKKDDLYYSRPFRDGGSVR